MGFHLLDNRNPNGDHFYAAAVRKLAAVVHITAGLQDLDGVDDHSCEATCNYAATTDRAVSWHGGSDTDSYRYLLPPRYVAWHVVDYNTATYGWEISKTHTDWRVMADWWVESTLRQAAAGLRPVLRELGIPIRKATKAELDHAIATGGAPVGLISHAELQPSDRTDPGLVRGVDTFPWARFLELLRAPDHEDDDMILHGEWSPGDHEQHVITFPSQGEKSYFGLATGWEDAKIEAIFFVAADRKYLPAPGAFTLRADARRWFPLPKGTDQVSVQFSSKRRVAYSVELG